MRSIDQEISKRKSAQQSASRRNLEKLQYKNQIKCQIWIPWISKNSLRFFIVKIHAESQEKIL